MKTSDEVKKSLDAHCRPFSCGECEYEKMIFCRDHLIKDAHALIQQLEAERNALIGALERGDVCSVCKHEELDEDQLPCATCCGGRSNWQWRGVQKEE